MTQSMSLRAASVGASSLIVGALVVVALTASTSVLLLPPPEIGPPPIDMAAPPLPPPPPPTTIRPPTAPIAHTAPSPDAQRVADNLDAVPQLTPIAVASDASGPVTITDPHWTQRPSNLARYYPPRALDRAMRGEVTLDCIVRVTGALDCAAISETPQGWGFAEAALRISRDYAMAPAMRDGAPVEGRYRMRVPFDLR